MIRRFSVLFLALSTVSATAFEPTPYDQELNFEFLGVHDKGLIVSMADQVMLCELAEAEEKDYLSLSDCRPVLSPAKVTELEKAEFISTFNALPTETYSTAIKAVIKGMGCSFLIDETSEAAFFKALASRVASENGYTGELTADLVDGVMQAADPAADELGSSGQLVFDRETSILSLVDCE